MRVFALILLVCASAQPADEPAQVLFNRLRAGVVENVRKVPRYTCVETVTRTQTHLQLGTRASCPVLIAARKSAGGTGLLVWHDRLRLDVAVGEKSEMYSWAGASHFETGELDKLALSGSTGTGAFSSFLTGVFGGEPDRFEYTGVHDGLAVFDYRVPLARSHYRYRSGNGVDTILPYSGALYAAPDSAELRRLTVEATEFTAGEACRVQNTLDYHYVKIGAGDFLLPEVSTMSVLYKDADETVNETRFSGCHEYVGESTIRFEEEGDAAKVTETAKAELKAIPPKTKIRVKLATRVDTDHAAAGDEVQAVADRESKTIHKGDLLIGRLLRLEQFMTPSPHWVVAIRFDEIERDGVRQPLTVLPTDDGDRTPSAGFNRRIRRAPLPTEPKGAGIYGFDVAGKLVLDDKFRSEWEVVK